MNENLSVVAGILGGLLLALLFLPISIGGTGSTLFTGSFWVLVIGIAATLIFAIATRRHQH